jgi:tetratricopeptide (TPR) repeat protein
VRYVVDDLTLWDTPVDADEAHAELDRLLALSRHGDAAWHTAVGNGARLLRRLELAQEHQSAALRLALAHGTPRQAVLARVRYAHVLQWQRRFPAAMAEFALALDAVADAGDAAHFVYQHAGKCCYDVGDWDRAAALFETALRLRTAAGNAVGTATGDAALVASSRQAVDATAACAVTAAVGRELNRLVPAVHGAARPVSGGLVAPLRPHVGVVVDLRTLLLRGAAPLPAVRAVHRHHPDLDGALAALASGGWLVVGEGTVRPTDRCRDLLVELMSALDTVCTTLWGAPDAALTAVGQAEAEAGAGTAGAASAALVAAGHPGDGTTAGRLFTVLCTLRHHRADAHAAALASDGLTAGEAATLPADNPRRQWLEATTDRLTSRAYRHHPDPAALLAELRALSAAT